LTDLGTTYFKLPKIVIISYLRICKAPLTKLAIQRRSQHGSPEEIPKNVFRQGKEEGGNPVRILLQISGEIIPHRRTHTRKGTVQSWSEELADQGDQQTGEGRKRGKTQVFTPGLRDILE